ncbi:MAG: AAA family ATPase [Actinobacteria bacterium]|nr:AAA family ATPase [Actinomycetota bacterium]
MARTAWRLPAATNRFVGRAADVSGVEDALRTARLVTVTGPGGVGKTRLALEVARKRATGSVPIVMVDLSSIGEARMVATAFAEAVGVPGARREAIADVVRFLGEVKAIVVVDNCEHLAEAAAEAVMSLLEGCPKLRVLATSRSRLRLPGETVWALGPLDREDAFRLFVERAEAVRAGAVGGASAAIEMLCERLEGLPLALELAAARVAILPPETILARLDGRLGVLTTAARGVPPRQRSLRATIEWSVELLSDEERQAFTRLSVFPGSLSLEAAEAVVGAELDVLEGLVTQSLVMVLPRAGSEPRYRMLDALRSYAQEQLTAAGGEDELRDRHLRFFVARAEAVHAASAMGGSQADISALSEDLDNLRAALAWSLEHAPSDGLRLIGTSRQVWYRGGQAEGRDWAARLLDLHPEDDRGRALGLLAVGQFAVGYQDHASSRPRLLAAADLARRLGDPAVEGGGPPLPRRERDAGPRP